jgi:hypothetical protein
MKQISCFIAGILLTAGGVKGDSCLLRIQNQIRICFAEKAWSCI